MVYFNFDILFHLTLHWNRCISSQFYIYYFKVKICVTVVIQICYELFGRGAPRPNNGGYHEYKDVYLRF